MFEDSASVTTIAEFSESGNYVLRLTANDGSMSVIDEVAVLVRPEPPKNQVPVLNLIGDKVVNENELLSFIIIAKDLDNEELDYKAMNLPIGAIFDSSSKEAVKISKPG